MGPGDRHGVYHPYWITFKQAQTLSANVRKDDQGYFMVYADIFKNLTWKNYTYEHHSPWIYSPH